MRSFTALCAFIAFAATAHAQILSEDFNGQTGMTGGDPLPVVTSGSWVNTNLSSPVGTLPRWFIPSTAPPFPAHQGGTQDYAAVNFNSGGGVATISNWLISPQVPLAAGNTLTFYTRSIASNFPDRLQVRLSTNGASTNVGASATSTGDFSVLLQDINPTYVPGPGGYPGDWTQFSIVLTAAQVPSPTNGRLAFRYFVENSGPSGANGDYLGIDTIRYVPEPATLGLLSLALLAMRRR